MLYDRLQKLVKGLGAKPVAIEAAEHDRAMAVVSHLPHVLANQLAAQGRPGTERLGALAPSLRDGTRVAGSNPAIWGEIFATNHEAVVAAIEESIVGLERAAEVIGSADPERIAAWQAAVGEDRAALSGDRDRKPGRPIELRVLVPNQPGVLADLALALGRAGVNITDMSLDPTPGHELRSDLALGGRRGRGRQGRGMHRRPRAFGLAGRKRPVSGHEVELDEPASEPPSCRRVRCGAA